MLSPPSSCAMLLLVLDEGGLTSALTVRLAAFVQSVIAFALPCVLFSPSFCALLMLVLDEGGPNFC